MEDSIFSQEWRRCLQEHYKYVVRNDDTITRDSLEKVLLSQAVNFSEDDLQTLYVEATAHVEDMPDGFVPDMQRAGATSPEQAEPVSADVHQPANEDMTFIAHPAECTCPSCMESVANESLHDEEGQPLSPEALEERIAEQEEQAKASEKQMRMF
ncbi:MAG: hypothetical protein H6670_04970 [Anaerolineaceae bacterium]|nr:hypothetical protein [Anaerolineaceae bacterium]